MNENYILLVEDSATQAVRLMEMMKDIGYAVVHRKNGKEALEYLKNNGNDFVLPELIISDISMPVMNGYELCRAVRAKFPDIIFIMITSVDDEDAMDKSYQAGASDFVTKPIAEKELLARINNLIYVNIAELQVKCLLHELTEKNDILSKLSITDELTTLYNRRYIIEQLELRIQEVARYETPLSIIMTDINNFKHINDAYGHTVGDEVLKKISFEMKNNLRNHDLLGRYGGEEFLTVLPSTCLGNAKIVAQKVRNAVKSVKFKQLPKLNITISSGIAEYKQNITYKEFIEFADNCLYKAKQNGKDRVES
jgi:two-component system, cell cycle response regulator